MMKNAFYFILKTLYVLTNLVNKQLQYTYCLISHEVQEKHFSLKTKQEIMQGDYFQTSFSFLKRLYMR